MSSTPQTIVRSASASDAASLARMLYEFNREFEADTDDEAVLAARFTRILDEPAVLALIASDGGHDLGFALVTLRPAIWFEGPVAVLDELYVVPELRDRGIGSALIARTRALLRERGCPELHINVDEVDTDTRRFYERHGFVTVEPGTEFRMLCYIGPT